MRAPIRWCVASLGILTFLAMWMTRTGERTSEKLSPLLRPPRATEKSPDFQLSDFEGNEWRLGDLRGRKVLLDFFCGCTPCRSMAREQARLASRWGNVQILVVSYLDHSKIRAFQKDTDLSVPFLMDPFGDVGERYDSLTCPRCWVIDENGNILYTNRDAKEDVHTVVQRAARFLER